MVADQNALAALCYEYHIYVCYVMCLQLKYKDGKQHSSRSESSV
jgi:hypothetical protein